MNFYQKREKEFTVFNRKGFTLFGKKAVDLSSSPCSQYPQLKGQLAELKKKETVSAEKKDELINQMEKITEDLKKQAMVVMERQKKIDINVPSTGVGYRGSVSGLSKFVKQCKVCSNEYVDTSFSLLGYDNICPKCREKPSQ